MWQVGTFSFTTASGLSNAIFFYNCKAFAFRGGLSEHWDLQAEQFKIERDKSENKKYVLFEGRINNNQGGLTDRHIMPKCIKHYEDKFSLA